MEQQAGDQIEECDSLPNVPLDIHIGDRVRMRKPHPCGGYEWEVTRVGADIGIRCLTCGRRVMLPRSKLEKRVKAVLDAATDTATH
jgi:hypothetical protein